MNKHLDLPFDQYTRQQLATEIINTIRKPNEKFKILDVGGYKGKTAAFFKNDNVTVLDIFDVKEKNYVKGDGTNLAFDDDSFDFVCSFDVLEHIPRDSRKAYIAEALRVSRIGVILACPFNSVFSQAAEYEIILNKIFREINGREHPWLKEHIEYVLPKETEIEDLLKGYNYCKGYSNLLDEWALIQEGIFMANSLDSPSLDIGNLNRYYNQHSKNLEMGINSKNAYRVVYFASKKENLSSRVDHVLNRANSPINHKAHMLLRIEILTALSGVYVQNHESQKSSIDSLTLQVEQYSSRLNEMENSISWKITKPIRSIKGRIS